MYVEALTLTAEGSQASKDAKQGGVYIKPTKVILGDYVGASQPSESLLGHTVYEAPIDFVEVLGKNCVRFTFSVPQSKPEGVVSCTIGEALVVLDDGRTLGYAQFKEPQIKTQTYGIRFSLLLSTEIDIGSVIDVTMAEHTSIPSVPDVENLPKPGSSILNAVSVLGLHANSDGTASPGLAYRYGSGGLSWGFSEHDRVFCDALGPRMVSATQFTFDDVGLSDGEIVIAQVVSGPGSGSVRKLTLSGRYLICSGPVIPFLDRTSTLAIWKRVVNKTVNSNAIPWPDASALIPEDWILARGVNNQPAWVPAPAANKATSAVNGVTRVPGKLVIRSLITTAVTDKLSYTLPNVPADAGHTLMALSSVTQLHNAYDVQADKLELSEYVDMNMPMDIRMFLVEPSQGHICDSSFSTYLTDGQTMEYDIPSSITSVDQIIAIYQRCLLPTTAYTITPEGKMRLSEVPTAGRYLTLYFFSTSEKPNNTSYVSHTSFYTHEAQSQFVLHSLPESKSMVLFNENGALLHPDWFDVVNNVVTTKEPIAKGRAIDIIVIENLSTANVTCDGVFTHAYMTSKGFVFERSNAAPICLPVLPPTFRSGPGIKISGTWPSLEITNTTVSDANRKIATYSKHSRVENTEEIVVSKKLDVVFDSVIEVTADFAASLGPGFTPAGDENIEYVVCVSGAAQAAPEYGRLIKGTDSAGFNTPATTNTSTVGYANASMSQTYNVIANNHPAGYVEVVCKMRVNKANVSAYGSKLSACVNVKVTPN